MSTLNKLDTFEISKHGDRLPRELYKIIRDYLLCDYDAIKWGLSYTLANLTREGRYDQFLGFNDTEDTIKELIESLQNAKTDEQRKHVMRKIEIFMQIAGDDYGKIDPLEVFNPNKKYSGGILKIFIDEGIFPSFRLLKLMNLSNIIDLSLLDQIERDFEGYNEYSDQRKYDNYLRMFNTGEMSARDYEHTKNEGIRYNKRATMYNEIISRLNTPNLKQPIKIINEWEL